MESKGAGLEHVLPDVERSLGSMVASLRKELELRRIVCLYNQYFASYPMSRGF